MFKSILPQASFARFAEGRLDFDGDDEEYSHYLTRFADQQSLARRLMGGNVRHYNSRQQEKDAGAVNRGDFLFFGGAGDKSERKRITPVTVTKPTVVKQEPAEELTDEKLNEIKGDVFNEAIQRVLKGIGLIDLTEYKSIKMDKKHQNANRRSLVIDYDNSFGIAKQAFENAEQPVQKNDNYIADVTSYCTALDDLEGIIDVYEKKRESINDGLTKLEAIIYGDNAQLTEDQQKEYNDLKTKRQILIDNTPDIASLKSYVISTRNDYYDKLGTISKVASAFAKRGVYDMQDKYPNYDFNCNQLLKIYRNKKGKRNEFHGFTDNELAAVKIDDSDIVESDNDDNEVETPSDMSDNEELEADNKSAKNQKKKNPDLIDVKSTPVKNDTVKDTTGSNGIAFNAQPALEQDKRSVSHEQRVGKANDVGAQKDVYDKWFKDRFKLKNYDEDDDDDYTYTEEQDDELPSTPVSDKPVPIKEEMYQRYFHKKLKRPEQRAVKREILLVTRNELNPKSIRPERTRYQERKRKTDKEVDDAIVEGKEYVSNLITDFEDFKRRGNEIIRKEEEEKRTEENRKPNHAKMAFFRNYATPQLTKEAEKRLQEEREQEEEKRQPVVTGVARNVAAKNRNLKPYSYLDEPAAYAQMYADYARKSREAIDRQDPQNQIESAQKVEAEKAEAERIANAVKRSREAREAYEKELAAKMPKWKREYHWNRIKNWSTQTWLGQKIWAPPQKKAAVEAVQDAAAANVADGPVAAAVAAKTAVEAEAQADEANLVVPAEPALPEFVPPADPAEPVAPVIEPFSEDEDEKPEKKSDPYDRMMDLLAGDSKNATKLMKYKKFKAQQEKDRNKRLEDNLKWFSDRMQERRGHSSSGSLSGFKKWDPFSQPLNKNFRTQKMENRLQQTVPPYDLPKNYPIYGGAMPGYPRVNSVPYPVYARRGRTGRRTNYEKYGVPSVRMYQQMLRNGLPPNVVARAAGRPRAVPQPPVEEQNIGPTPQYMPEYDDGPTYAEDRSYDYGQQVQKIAKNLMWGPPRRYTTGNQIVGSVLPNTTSGMPSAYYMGAKALDYITPEGQTDKEKLENMLANVKITQMVEDVKSEDDKKRLREMAKNFGNLNESGWKKALRWGATGASLGLKGLGVLSENFWPMHDAYYRYKTMSSLGGIGKSLLGMMPRGFGYRRRKKRSNKKCRKGKVCYGGMIIPPKSLKKMFEENKCDLKY